MINPAGRTWLLAIAREAIRAHVEGRAPTFAPRPHEPLALPPEPRGVFVSLHMGVKLRGCMGAFASERPLDRTVAEYAVRSASADPRFPPLIAAELDRVHLELSVLSALEPLEDPSRVEVGRHGIVIRGQGPYASRQGCYLPQVAVMHRMDRKSFLTHCCAHKAGLPGDAWRDGSLAKVLVFTAEVFSEPNPDHG